MRALQPPGWPRARGYAHGIEASGRLVFTAGQIGWGPDGGFPSSDLAGQVRQTLENVLAVLAEAGAGPEHVVRLTWYVTSREEYLAAQKEIGEAYRAVMGRHFPAMAVVVEAKVEIEATAVVPG
jgi:enamine deaminase RidA (YjgF/YER057c/UK114 family)